MQLAFYYGPGDMVTKIIRLVTKGHISHVELVFSDGRWVGSTGRGLRRGVRWRPPPDLRRYWIAVPVQATELQEQHVRAFVDANIGVPFDWSGLVSFLIPIFKENPARMYCSNFVVKALHHAGLHTSIPARITPMRLYELVSTNLQPSSASETEN